MSGKQSSSAKANAKKGVTVAIDGEFTISDGDRSYEAETVRLWRSWTLTGVQADQVLTWRHVDGVAIVDVRLCHCHTGDQDTMVVVRGVKRGKKVVAFHRGLGAVQSIKGFLDRYEAGSVAWKDDSPADGSGPAAAAEPPLARPVA